MPRQPRVESRRATSEWDEKEVGVVRSGVEIEKERKKNFNKKAKWEEERRPVHSFYGAASCPREYEACQLYPGSGGEGRAKKASKRNNFTHTRTRTTVNQCFAFLLLPQPEGGARFPRLSYCLAPCQCLCVFFAHAFLTSTGNRWSKEYGAKNEKTKDAHMLA